MAATTSARSVAARTGLLSRRPVAWLTMSFTFFTVTFGTNVPTPLLLVYRHDLHLSQATLTAIFGVYAAGLVPALLLAGSSSDRLGRRRVMVPFVVLSGLASLVFIPAVHSVPLLYLGRFLQGVVSGVVFSVGSAWLQELSDPARPELAARRAALAMTSGFSLGPLTSGLLAQWAPAPTTLPYLVHTALVTLGLLAVLPVAETVLVPRPGRLLQLGLPPGTARTFWLVLAPMAFCVFAFPSVTITVLPLMLDLGRYPLALTGLLGAITLGAGFAIQPIGRHLGTWTAPTGVGLGAVGFALSILAAHVGGAALLVVVSLLLGGGSGLCLFAGLTLVQQLSPPQTRGALNAAFYACAYVGFAAPLVLSIAIRHLGLTTPYAVAAGLFALLSGWYLLDRRREARSRFSGPEASA